MNKANRGVTLIELMIVVTIVSILAAVAYPAYTQYIVKTKRGIAASTLVQLANRQEQYFLDNKEYADTFAKLGAAGAYVNKNGNMSSTATDAVYQLSIASTTRTFTLTAAPQSAQTEDTKCANLTLNEKGEKGISGSGTVKDCW